MVVMLFVLLGMRNHICAIKINKIIEKKRGFFMKIFISFKFSLKISFTPSKRGWRIP